MISPEDTAENRGTRVVAQAGQVPSRYAAVYGGYAAALEASRLGTASQVSYLSRIRSFLAWLGSAEITGADPLRDAGARDAASAAYLGYLSDGKNLAAKTVYDHHVTLDHFYEHLGLGPTRVQRAEAPRRDSRALDLDEQALWVAELQRRPLARDRAMGWLLLRAGLRTPELAALDLGDVDVADDRTAGTVTVREGSPREVPLEDRAALADLAAWIGERQGWPGAAGTPALFLNSRRTGRRLAARRARQLVIELADAAGLVDEDRNPDAPARRLRLTYAVNLIRAGTDIVTVADRLGVASLEIDAIRNSLRQGPAPRPPRAGAPAAGRVPAG